ncbi:MAG TPA: flagellar brake protein [Rhodocyclaceae bacterium]
MAQAPGGNPPRTTQLEDTQGDYSKYLLYSRTEIRFLIRSIIQKGALITLHFDHGKAFILTALIAISDDGNWIYLDYGGSEEMNQRALQAEKLIAATMLDKVKIQFSLSGLQATQASGRPVFAAHLPETVLRLQRREFFRLPTPIANPWMCRTTLRIDGEAAQDLDINLLDISGGGVGLMMPTTFQGKLPVGTLLPDCHITLPEEGAIHTTLCVRNAFASSNRAGQPYLRMGCEFVDLPGTALTLIQRYITRVERDRKGREAGN